VSSITSPSNLVHAHSPLCRPNTALKLRARVHLASVRSSASSACSAVCGAAANFSGRVAPMTTVLWTRREGCRAHRAFRTVVYPSLRASPGTRRQAMPLFFVRHISFESAEHRG
jgi:hypothetical protein